MSYYDDYYFDYRMLRDAVEALAESAVAGTSPEQIVCELIALSGTL